MSAAAFALFHRRKIFTVETNDHVCRFSEDDNKTKRTVAAYLLHAVVDSDV